MTTDLFTWLDALWNKKKPEGTFPYFVAHRFLASNRGLAEVARVLWRDVRDPAMIFATWQGLLPNAGGAPQGNDRLVYPAPKKGPEAEALTVRMMAMLAENRCTVEEMIAIVTMLGRDKELYVEFGIQHPSDKKPVKNQIVENTGVDKAGLFGLVK